MKASSGIIIGLERVGKLILMSKILITGADGFIGRHLGKELTSHGHMVTGIDRRDGDLSDPGVARYLISRASPDVVCHLAAQVGRLFGEQDLSFTIKANAIVTGLVAQACDEMDARLVYASTSEVYGDQGNNVVYEDSPMDIPYNAYGLTKRWGEEICQLYAPIDLKILRLSMPYGPGLPPGKGRAAIINMLAQAHNKEEIIVHEGAERCWCWIGDTVAAARLVIEKGWGAAYNIGRDDNRIGMIQVAQMALRIANPNGDPLRGIKVIAAPANQVLVKRLNTDKIRALGWQPRVDLLEGMQLTYEEMKKDGSL